MGMVKERAMDHEGQIETALNCVDLALLKVKKMAEVNDSQSLKAILKMLTITHEMIDDEQQIIHDELND